MLYICVRCLQRNRRIKTAALGRLVFSKELNFNFSSSNSKTVRLFKKITHVHFKQENVSTKCHAMPSTSTNPIWWPYKKVSDERLSHLLSLSLWFIRNGSHFHIPLKQVQMQLVVICVVKGFSTLNKLNYKVNMNVLTTFPIFNPFLFFSIHIVYWRYLQLCYTIILPPPQKKILWCRCMGMWGKWRRLYFSLVK